jgi:hypothetical protein
MVWPVTRDSRPSLLRVRDPFAARFARELMFHAAATRDRDGTMSGVLLSAALLFGAAIFILLIGWKG